MYTSQRELQTHKLDGDRLRVEQVGTLENDTKRSFPNLFAYSIMDTDDIA